MGGKRGGGGRRADRGKVAKRGGEVVGERRWGGGRGDGPIEELEPESKVASIDTRCPRHLSAPPNTAQ